MQNLSFRHPRVLRLFHRPGAWGYCPLGMDCKMCSAGCSKVESSAADAGQVLQDRLAVRDLFVWFGAERLA